MKRMGSVAVIIAALLALAGCGGASPATSGGGAAEKLVVWNWSRAEEAAQVYQDDVLAAFKRVHPEVEVEIVSQPFDQYYTLLGSAIESGTGPDVALFNGGTQLKSRADRLVPITDELADLREGLTGWPAFEVDDQAYSAPMSLQGFPIYFNKSIFAAAGLDPAAPPTTWDGLTSACEAILAATDKSCFALGNKEGLGIEFFLSGLASGVLTPEEYDQWIDGERDWTGDHAKQLLRMWQDTSKAGWYNEGANSTAMFYDSFDLFSGGSAAMAIGLTSGSAHWQQFAEFLGDDLGFMMPVTVNEGTTPALPIEGGIGYGILNEERKDLGVDWITATVDHEALSRYAVGGGQIVSDTSVTMDTDIAAAQEIMAAVPTGKPLLHTALAGPELDLLHRLGQQLLIGEVSVDDAARQLAASGN